MATNFQRIAQSSFGRAAWLSAKEMVGFSYSSMFGVNPTPEGWLGIRGKITELAKAKDPIAGGIQRKGWKGGLAAWRTQNRRTAPIRSFNKARGLGFSRSAALKISTRNMIKRSGIGFAGKVAGRAALTSIGPVMGAAYIYSGYKENGVLGAAGAGAETIAMNMALRLIPGVGYAAAAAAIGYGAYELGETGREHGSKLRGLEMGGGAIINAIGSNNALTGRQRSAMALQNTHLNGRMVLGSEAQMLHVPYR
jgi:hypothetical protein